GGYTAVQLGISHPDRALSLTAAGAGSGSERARTEEFRKSSLALAEEFEKKGSEAVVKNYGMSPTRIPYLIKDPRGFADFNVAFAQHDAQGSANTMRSFQAARPSLYDFEAEIRNIKVPTLIIVGDEDEPCLEPSFFL